MPSQTQCALRLKVLQHIFLQDQFCTDVASLKRQGHSSPGDAVDWNRCLHFEEQSRTVHIFLKPCSTMVEAFQIYQPAIYRPPDRTVVCLCSLMVRRQNTAR